MFMIREKQMNVKSPSTDASWASFGNSYLWGPFLNIKKPPSINRTGVSEALADAQFFYLAWIGVQVGSTQPFHLFFVSFTFFMVLSSSLQRNFIILSDSGNSSDQSRSRRPFWHVFCPALPFSSL
jgi:hypothetical protein